MNKHAPMRKASRKEKQLQKNWLTAGIWKSIHYKNKMYVQVTKCFNKSLFSDG